MKKFYGVIFIVFIIVYVLYGHLVIGGLASLRILMSLFVFILAFFIHKKPLFDKPITSFIIFVFFYGISSAVTGYTNVYIAQLLRLYVVAYLAYYSTYVFAHNNGNSSWLIYALVCIGLLDALITIGQYYNLSFRFFSTEAFNLYSSEEFEEIASLSESLSGQVLPGVFGYVANGYYLSVFTILSLYCKDSKLHWWNFMLWLIMLYALYLCQERMALVAGLFLSLFVMYKTLRAHINPVFLVLFFLGGAIGLYVFMDGITSGDMRYSYGFTMDSRLRLWSNAIEFLFEHPFLGGQQLFISQNQAAHNVFINAFLYGGLIGGVCIVILLFHQLIKTIQYILKPIQKINTTTFFFALSFIAYTINSLTHNLSVVSGDGFIWILWGLFYYLQNNNSTRTV